MSELIEVAELISVAIEDEKTAVAFYSALADKTQRPELKALFARTAEQEKFHQKRFEEMLERSGGVKTRQEYPGQYLAYLRALTADRAFPDAQQAAREARQFPSDAAAVEAASRMERDTLMLMGELRGLVGPKDQAVVEELVQEEQEHLVSLAQARKALLA